MLEQRVEYLTVHSKVPNSTMETSSERPPELARLTKENLKALEEMHRTINGESTSTVAGGSRTDSSFPRLTFENGILDTLHSTPPGNFDYLQDRLDRERNSPPPTKSEYDYFVYEIMGAPDKMAILHILSKFLRDFEPGYARAVEQAFDDFPKNIGFNDGLPVAKPQFCEGLLTSEFEPFPIRYKLGGPAVPIASLNPPTLPHLAGEVEEPETDVLLATAKAAYDGACMVYGRCKAREFLEDADPVGHAFVSTFVINGGILNIFANYSLETPAGTKYHQCLISSSSLMESYEDFKKAVRRLRNMQDDAKEVAEKLKGELCEKWILHYQLVLQGYRRLAKQETGNTTDT
ncbi:hypothetical protein ACMFMG_003789 [Clarireedia jacksonii]